ncbi:hypothetical protein DUNSADRAFT_1510 [Dunaliella salina]|uniref:CNNM transmembrane domain-containing protein n=1 Tax=Dunaliella salina TaxID=3046 RepID=A0ABQ7GX51_DUNSA|nr:hypothetical protein DUNSADRAFT_1510 [Dunaliella salina]|eukprot:KAF5839112.1 hypothetical protein DUNSADRAFT_1510 [Dunaliella salina]
MATFIFMRRQIISVTGVLLFGEILPQALCARHALAICQACTGLATLLMVITAPVSWPVAKLLDFLLDLASPKHEDDARYVL